MKALRWRLFFLTSLVLGALYAVIPTCIYFASPRSVRENASAMEARIPSWLSRKHIQLGLDLQGGVQLVLGVATQEALSNKLGSLAVQLQRSLQERGVELLSSYVNKEENRLILELEDGDDARELEAWMLKEYPQLRFVAQLD